MISDGFSIPTSAQYNSTHCCFCWQISMHCISRAFGWTPLSKCFVL
jgi:hypothetical protein